MMMTIILISFAAGALGLSLLKDSSKTLASLKGAKNMMGNMLSDIIGILLLIGLLLALLPPDTIKNLIGGEHSLLSTVLAALIGSITLIPGFVAFPLTGSLARQGANLMALTAFLTTLMMVGLVTYPLERQTFGHEFAIKRNVLSFIFALIIAGLIGILV